MKLHIQKSVIELTDPFWALAGAFANEPCGVLLDSGMDPDKLGQFSFLTARPSALLRAKRVPSTGAKPHEFQLELQRWINPDGSDSSIKISRRLGSPTGALRELQEEYGQLENNDHGIPFTGGITGYIGYETAYAGEILPDEGLDDLQLPDIAFMVTDEVFVHNHQTQQTHLFVTGRGLNSSDSILNAQDKTNYLLQLVANYNFPERKETLYPCAAKNVKAHFTREAYMQAVDQCKEHILAGDAFEICLTHRLQTEFTDNPWKLYQDLRANNPAPFASYLHFPGFQVISASPERFLKLSNDGQIESRPIKGTRPRGDNPWDDQRLRDELQNSAKDKAENVMIVDLVRNDIGKVAEIGSVEVPELLAVEPYATVFQMVSTVRGQLRPEKDAFDLVEACFPGGSMTGAPKIEAMKIIDSLEPVKRGIYSGAIGYFDRSGCLDLSIVIRTVVCKDGMAYLGVGGAVVADSDSEAEYEETLDKARALLLALGGKL
ncbi:MAG: aminodeoxychorismate synthase component I [bacterium]|nr:aminodeoxychorismate synthase component I [bacterium]